MISATNIVESKRSRKPKVPFVPDDPRIKKYTRNPDSAAKGRPKKEGRNRNEALSANDINKWNNYRLLVKRALAGLAKELHYEEVYTLMHPNVSPDNRELQIIQRKIYQWKMAINTTLQAIDAENADHKRWPELGIADEDDMVDIDHVLCSKCGTEETEENDILLCDKAHCFRAYHQQCLDPPVALDAQHFNPEDSWFCWQCECMDDCLDMIGEKLEKDDAETWQDLFPELVGDSEGGGTGNGNTISSMNLSKKLKKVSKKLKNGDEGQGEEEGDEEEVEDDGGDKEDEEEEDEEYAIVDEREAMDDDELDEDDEEEGDEGEDEGDDGNNEDEEEGGDEVESGVKANSQQQQDQQQQEKHLYAQLLALQPSSSEAAASEEAANNEEQAAVEEEEEGDEERDVTDANDEDAVSELESEIDEDEMEGLLEDAGDEINYLDTLHPSSSSTLAAAEGGGGRRLRDRSKVGRQAGSVKVSLLGTGEDLGKEVARVARGVLIVGKVSKVMVVETGEVIAEAKDEEVEDTTEKAKDGEEVEQLEKNGKDQVVGDDTDVAHPHPAKEEDPVVANQVINEAVDQAKVSELTVAGANQPATAPTRDVTTAYQWHITYTDHIHHTCTYSQMQAGFALYDEYLQLTTSAGLGQHQGGNGGGLKGQIQQLVSMNGLVSEQNVLAQGSKRRTKEIDYINLSLQLFGSLHDEDDILLDSEMQASLAAATSSSSSSAIKKGRLNQARKKVADDDEADMMLEIADEEEEEDVSDEYNSDEDNRRKRKKKGNKQPAKKKANNGSGSGKKRGRPAGSAGKSKRRSKNDDEEEDEEEEDDDVREGDDEVKSVSSNHDERSGASSDRDGDYDSEEDRRQAKRQRNKQGSSNEQGKKTKTAERRRSSPRTRNQPRKRYVPEEDEEEEEAEEEQEQEDTVETAVMDEGGKQVGEEEVEKEQEKEREAGQLISVVLGHRLLAGAEVIMTSATAAAVMDM